MTFRVSVFTKDKDVYRKNYSDYYEAITFVKKNENCITLKYGEEKTIFVPYYNISRIELENIEHER